MAARYPYPQRIDYVFNKRTKEQNKAERDRQGAFVFTNEHPMKNGRTYRLLLDKHDNIIGWRDITDDEKTQHYFPKATWHGY